MRMKPRRLLIILIVVLLKSYVHAQSPEERIQAILSRPEFAHSLFGIKVYSLDHKKTLYAFNSEKYFKPASTTKLLTMGTALGVLGADHRFHTRLYATGKIKKGTLEGNLVLVA